MSQKVGLTREQVRLAALNVFSAKGFGGSSMGDVAACIGVTKASLYHYHHSKESVLEAAVGPYVDDLRVLVSGVRGGPVEDKASLLRGFLSPILASKARAKGSENDYIQELEEVTRRRS
jgi:AcrR family transcriptional regulator